MNPKKTTIKKPSKPFLDLKVKGVLLGLSLFFEINQTLGLNRDSAKLQIRFQQLAPRIVFEAAYRFFLYLSHTFAGEVKLQGYFFER